MAKRDSTMTLDDAASIGMVMVEAAERVRVIDKICPGSVTTVHLFVDGVEYSVFVKVKRDD